MTLKFASYLVGGNISFYTSSFLIYSTNIILVSRSGHDAYCWAALIKFRVCFLLRYRGHPLSEGVDRGAEKKRYKRLEEVIYG
jgi:hypothetical protein